MQELTELSVSGSASACTQWMNSFMQSLLQKVSFYLHCSLDVNKDKIIPSAAVTA